MIPPHACTPFIIARDDVAQQRPWAAECPGAAGDAGRNVAPRYNAARAGTRRRAYIRRNDIELYHVMR